jgi:thiol-disulfide isomerase/thioredoxin
VVFVDFWGTWCGACLSDIPTVNQLKAKFKDQPVTFLYLCSRCPETAFEKALRTREIKGVHYKLTEEDQAALDASLSLTYYPRYLLVDKQGKIVNADAKLGDQLAGEVTDLLNQ